MQMRSSRFLKQRNHKDASSPEHNTCFEMFDEAMTGPQHIHLKTKGDATTSEREEMFG
jgi:hypothetical protein